VREKFGLLQRLPFAQLQTRLGDDESCVASEVCSAYRVCVQENLSQLAGSDTDDVIGDCLAAEMCSGGRVV
jgi:hypothetical protein